MVSTSRWPRKNREAEKGRDRGRRFGAGPAEMLLPLLGRLTHQEDIVAVADPVMDCATAEDFLKRLDAPGEGTAAG